jgi:hypothetical protein
MSRPFQFFPRQFSYSATSHSLLKNGIPTDRWLRSTSAGGGAPEYRVSYERNSVRTGGRVGELPPGGATDNSPALQRWETWEELFKSRRDG